MTAAPTPLAASPALAVVGADRTVPLLDGTERRYINLDNAASTPALACVRDTVDEFLEWYSNVHRGTGYKSRLSSWAFEQARDRVASFVRADQQLGFLLTKGSFHD